MRVVIINETLSLDMGYLGTMLPKHLVQLGLDVHVLTTDLPAYHALEEFKGGVPKFLAAQALPAGTTRVVDGYTIHVGAHSRVLGHVRMKGVWRKLQELRPDVVYCVLTIGWMPLEAAIARSWYRYKLFTGSHTTRLAFESTRSRSRGVFAKMREFAVRWIPGRFVSLSSTKCYCPTSDCAEIAVRFFGVQSRKTEVVHLGVDRGIFYPPVAEADRDERKSLRRELGFGEDDVVCIYTGKMTEAKNPLLLAHAIERMRAEGRSFRGLFVGDGAQRAAVERSDACTVLDFMVVKKLGPYYRASDIAVWPTTESTSMLDAVACGLPIVVSDRIYQDHVSGNGFAYRMNDLDSLCEVLRQLDDPLVRRELGRLGAKKMRDQFSWEAAARRRFDDFAVALARGRK